MAISNIQTTSVINATDSAHGLKPSAYYDKILLKVLRATDFKHRMFAKKKNLPKNYGDTINFRTYKKLDPKLTPLTEAMTPAPDSAEGSSITAVIKQYGAVMYFSDKVKNEQLDDVVTEYVIEQGHQARETLDLVARNTLITGAGTHFYAGGVSAAKSVVEKASIDDFRKMANGMKKQHIRGVKGNRYGVFVSVDVMQDLLDDERVQRLMEYGGTNKPMMDNEIVNIYNLSFVEVINPAVLRPGETDETGKETGSFAGTKEVHRSIMVGEEAYAEVNLSGENVKTFFKGLGSAGTEDPINQRLSIGWKINGYAVKVLKPQAVGIYYSANLR